MGDGNAIIVVIDNVISAPIVVEKRQVLKIKCYLVQNTQVHYLVKFVGVASNEMSLWFK